MRVLATVCVVGLALGALAAGAAAARTPPGFDGFDCVMRVSRAGPMLETCYAAARGDAAGAHKFGRALMQGDGMTRDLPMAVALLRRAAEAGLPAAALDLARAHQRGLGVPRDVEEAARWFRRAATDDYPRGKFELAVFLDGTRIADGEVVDLMRQAYRAARAKVAGEDVDALYVVGAIQTNDEYAPPYQFNPEDGMKLLRRAAQRGDVEAASRLGVALVEARRSDARATEDPLPWFRQAAARGEPVACLMLARMSGAGGARASADSARARLLYHCAAEQGIAVAMHELADRYLSGDGGDGALTDVAAARQWYFRAFEAGYEHAAGPAGAMAAAGRGGPRDEAAAVAVLQRMIELKIFDAADLRNLAAALAEHPETGRGALEVARAAVEEAGKRRDAYLWVPALAWIHFRLGDGAKAEAMLRAGLARFGGADNMDLRRTLGDVLHGLGRVAEARAEWQRALRGIEGTLGGLPLQRRLDLTK